MNLAAYLTRIGVNGALRPDLATLQTLHRAHQQAIAFENLDVQLRRPVHFDLDAAFDKLVLQRRGGWCYEMNGVMGWALAQIGFDVTRLCAGVMRERVGDGQLGNHLCLLVSLDRPYLVDVGFGGSKTATTLTLQRGAGSRRRAQGDGKTTFSRSGDQRAQLGSVVRILRLRLSPE